MVEKYQSATFTYIFHFQSSELQLTKPLLISPQLDKAERAGSPGIGWILCIKARAMPGSSKEPRI